MEEAADYLRLPQPYVSEFLMAFDAAEDHRYEIQGGLSMMERQADTEAYQGNLDGAAARRLVLRGRR